MRWRHQSIWHQQSTLYVPNQFIQPLHEQISKYEHARVLAQQVAVTNP
jgi:hypothetical protein